MQSHHRLFSLLLFFCFLGAASAFQAEDQPDDSESEIEKAWKMLAEGEPDCTEAVLFFAKRPDEAVKFFDEHLQPLRLDEESFTTLMSQLEDEDEETAKAAYEEFQYLDPRLALGLEEIMDKAEEGLVRTRMVEVLSGRGFDTLEGQDVELNKIGGGEDAYFNFSSGNGSWWAEVKISNIGVGAWVSKPKWTRAVRAIKILEAIDTPEATRILSRMAQGHPEAQPTSVAKQIAMKRKLDKRNDN